MIAELNEIDQKLREANYKFLGWANVWSLIGAKPPEILKCQHNIDRVEHNKQGTENTASCDVCKIYWKYDSSD